MESRDSDSLHQCLERFRALANDNLRVRKLVQGWRPRIYVMPNDGPTGFTATIDGAIGNWEATVAQTMPAATGGQPVIILSASTAVLAGVFSGERNPARAHLDGVLQVFADDRDQVKLDAVSLILWGV